MEVGTIFKEYYCVKDCYHNRRYFERGNIFTERELLLGLQSKRDEMPSEPQPLPKHLIQISPPLQEKSKEERDRIKNALQNLQDEINDYRRFGQNHPAVQYRIASIEIIKQKLMSA